MTGKKELSRRSAEILLALVIIARSTSLLFSKTALGSMEPLTLCAVRFILAFALLCLIFFKRIARATRRTVVFSALLGFVFFATMTAETYGLKYTDTSVTSLLENLAIVFVPLSEAALRRKAPGARTVVSCALSMGGVALITMRSGSFSFKGGDALCLLAAFFYTASIILTDRLSRKEDPLTLGILQVGFMGFFSLIAAVLFEHPSMPQSKEQWGCIIVLVIVCSVFGFTLQPLAQSKTTSERTGVMCALNPATALILGCLFLSEKPGVAGFIGAALILAGITVSGIHPKKKTAA